MASIVHVDDYEYDRSDLIGAGSFAVVFRGHKTSDKSISVALKQISIAKALTPSTMDKEMEIMKKIKHENIVQLLHHTKTPKHLYLVLEFCNNGDLAKYLEVKKTLSEDTIRIFLRQIASAIRAIHRLGVIHRDVKPHNLLLSCPPEIKNPHPQHITVKLADFGFARFLATESMAATVCGSPIYMAPEILLSGPYDAKCDLWSIGTVVYQCLYGKPPFYATTQQNLTEIYRRHKNLKPTLPEPVSSDLKDLLLHLLVRDPKKRMPMEEFFSHSFIADKQKSIVSEPVPIRRATGYTSCVKQGSQTSIYFEDTFATVYRPQTVSSSPDKISEEAFHPSSYHPPSLCRPQNSREYIFEDGNDEEENEMVEEEGFLMVYTSSKRTPSRNQTGSPSSLPEASVSLLATSPRRIAVSSPRQSLRGRTSQDHSSPSSGPSSLLSISPSNTLARLLSFARPAPSPPSSHDSNMSTQTPISVTSQWRRRSSHEMAFYGGDNGLRQSDTDPAFVSPFGFDCSPPVRPLDSGVAAFAPPRFIQRRTSSPSATRSSRTYGVSPPEMEGPISFQAPALEEETIMDRSHTEGLNKLYCVSNYVEEVLNVIKRHSNDENVNASASVPLTGMKFEEKLSLLRLCVRLLTKVLLMAQEEIDQGKMVPSRAVKKILKEMYELQQESLQECEKSLKGIQAGLRLVAPEKIVFSYAMELCQDAVLKEASGSVSDQCQSDYECALRLFSGLLENAQRDEDMTVVQTGKDALQRYLMTKCPTPHPECD